MTSSFKIILPDLKSEQNTRVPVPSITMQGARVPGNRLSLLFYDCTAKTARGMKTTCTASESHEILKRTKVGIH